MVYRIYVEKKKEFAQEAQALLNDINSSLEIDNLNNLRLINRYDVEHIEEKLFDYCIDKVFSEPQVDIASRELPDGYDHVFAVEYLPGQYDQRADSASQCIQIISQSKRPAVKSTKVYLLNGILSDKQIEKIKNYVINPVESCEASLETYKTLDVEYDIPTEVAKINRFINFNESELKQMLLEFGFAMDLDDIKFCQKYFISVKRNPTVTEMRMIDTYWSDHCRHTTFTTTINSVQIENDIVMSEYENYIKIRKELNRNKPINLMDIATIGARYLKSIDKLPRIDESEEINACTVKIDVDVDENTEEWLLLFKNETHNHPTEIEPFGGAATCIGGAIRDPLSGRSYVYQAMRVTGAGNPLTPVSVAIKGKLSQKKIVTTAAAGYSSYGNQIGLATGLVDEIYHDGYTAKRMEIGAVVGAVPSKNVVREIPQPGDVVLLIGGRTGRDGCGGATGSSKSHTTESLAKCGAEVQKGNAPEERKLQRLFRNIEAAKMIKRCNDFGAGGVSVAIGELADGLFINLDTVPKKYDGLDGTELAISESQERMAVVVAESDVDEFITLADSENLEATVVATVTEEPFLKMSWNGKIIVNISREFLNSNGVEKHIEVVVSKGNELNQKQYDDFNQGIFDIASDLNVCSKKGLSERFDSTIGAGSVLMPFDGKYQMTPTQCMAAKIPVLYGETKTCSVMAYGYNPFLTEADQYLGAYTAVVESVSKLVAAGAYTKDCYLTFQEYFERLGKNPSRWGRPFSALLGALRAQIDLGIAAIGGKDSMSGSFENIDVPPTLVSFAISTCNSDNIITPAFKNSGNKVVFVEAMKNGMLFDSTDLLKIYTKITQLISQKKVLSAYTPAFGGIAAAIIKMCLGNKIGFEFNNKFDLNRIFNLNYSSFILEVTDEVEIGELLGYTTAEYILKYNNDIIFMDKVQFVYESKLEPVFPTKPINYNTEIVAKISSQTIDRYSFKAKAITKPKVIIPVFPGTNCEYDTARAFIKAGANAEIIVIRNKTALDIMESINYFAEKIKDTQIIFIPGGFSGGDEPDGSGKFITAFFRNPKIKENVELLLDKNDGLIGGICNGFQALIKLGLVPYGHIVDIDSKSPTLTFNTIGRHMSRLVRTRVASNKSPWFSMYKVGEIYTMPVSHGEGRFICPEVLAKQLALNGQIATQYVDLNGNPTMDINYNPNGSMLAVEGITSPDGRIFGKMGHSERYGDNLYKNVDGANDSRIFLSAVKYFI
ncbi:MAG: phosphoribosylformylglycinamidine synthase [Clostridiales bacterium GWF2_38_85]|nr:MAG: phosphoribosylformylglycinamidine synthase [Clostridiales bacterium GWF2_38_85]